MLLATLAVHELGPSAWPRTPPGGEQCDGAPQGGAAEEEREHCGKPISDDMSAKQLVIARSLLQWVSEGRAGVGRGGRGGNPRRVNLVAHRVRSGVSRHWPLRTTSISSEERRDTYGGEAEWAVSRCGLECAPARQSNRNTMNSIALAMLSQILWTTSRLGESGVVPLVENSAPEILEFGRTSLAGSVAETATKYRKLLSIASVSGQMLRMRPNLARIVPIWAKLGPEFTRAPS